MHINPYEPKKENKKLLVLMLFRHSPILYNLYCAKKQRRKIQTPAIISPVGES